MRQLNHCLVPASLSQGPHNSARERCIAFETLETAQSRLQLPPTVASSTLLSVLQGEKRQGLSAQSQRRCCTVSIGSRSSVKIHSEKCSQGENSFTRQRRIPADRSLRRLRARG